MSKIFSAVGGGVSNNSNGTTVPPKGFNINGIAQSKIYEYKSPDRTYRLTLAVSSPLFSSPSATQEKPDISKYISLVDSTAKTLRVK